MEWIDGLNRSLKYIETHIDQELNITLVAKQACFSQFYLQRMFSMMTDMTLSEYIRQRRLSLAGQELQMTDEKVIDVALKYGYDTPESFCKAFRRFHGISPLAAKRARVQLKFLNPLTLHVNLVGGSIMDYSVENIGELTIVGLARQFDNDSAFGLIPKFWEEYYSQNRQSIVPGCLGVCMDADDGLNFEYLIASFCEPDVPAPDGYKKYTIPPHTWVKFKAVGPIPTALQALNRQIFTEWLPNNSEYEPAAPMNIEVYSMGDMNAEDYVSEIWLPVRKK